MNSTSEIQVLTGWLAKQADVHLDGTILTSPSYIVQGWLDAVVPGSVLATLFRNGKVKDPASILTIFRRAVATLTGFTTPSISQRSSLGSASSCGSKESTTVRISI
jgi:hypothetical protein